MQKVLILLLLLTGCTTPTYPELKCLQVNYIQNGKEHHLFLNVRKYPDDSYVVLSQEYKDSTDFIITEIFDYNAR